MLNINLIVLMTLYHVIKFIKLIIYFIIYNYFYFSLLKVKKQMSFFLFCASEFFIFELNVKRETHSRSEDRLRDQLIQTNYDE